jgi:hypothetical protein
MMQNCLSGRWMVALLVTLMFAGCKSPPQPVMEEAPADPSHQVVSRDRDRLDPLPRSPRVNSPKSAQSPHASSPNGRPNAASTSQAGRRLSTQAPSLSGASGSQAAHSPNSASAPSASQQPGEPSIAAPAQGELASTSTSSPADPSESGASQQPGEPSVAGSAQGQSASTSTSSPGDPSESGASQSDATGQAASTSSSTSASSSASEGECDNPSDANSEGGSPGASSSFSSTSQGSLPTESLEELTAPTTGPISEASRSQEGGTEEGDRREGDAMDESSSAETLPEVVGTVDAASESSNQAKDASWAVRPEELHGGESEEDEFAMGGGGGASGGDTGGRSGSGEGGNDGGSRAQGGGRLDVEAESDSPLGGGGPKAWDADLWSTNDQPSSDERSDDAAVGQAATKATKRDAFDFERDESAIADPPEASDADRRFDDMDLSSPQVPKPRRGSEAWHREVRGTWKLVDINDPSQDFLPNGATNRFIGIDPDGRRLAVVLTWEGELVSSLAAEYEVGFRPEVVDILPLPNSPSSFAPTQHEMPNGGRFIPAAQTPPCELKWHRSGDRLHIGGAEYVAVESDPMVTLLHQPAVQAGEGVTFDWKDGDSQHEDPAVTVDFFGVQAEGRFFCYVIDVSGSMEQNGGMLKLRMELERSLSSLPRGTRFAVLPFNHTLRDLQSQWTAASPAKASDLGQRLSRIGAKGGTNPAPAFDWAFRRLNPRPDAIFFMTDGQVKQEKQLLSQLATLNANMPRTRIHTIGLGGGADLRFLDQLASQHGGSSRAAP